MKLYVHEVGFRRWRSKRKIPSLIGARGGGDVRGVILCMYDGKAAFHCVNNRPKMGTQKVIGIEKKVVFEFSFKVWLVHEYCNGRTLYSTLKLIHSYTPPSTLHFQSAETHTEILTIFGFFKDD
jgi:hypothetical protein